MANFVIDGNLFKNIQSQIKRETEKFLGKGKGISVQLPEIREFVVENQEQMFANGGKTWVVDHFVKQIRDQRKSLSVVNSANEDIIIRNNYTEIANNTHEQKTELPVPSQQSAPLANQQQNGNLVLPSEILTEVQTKFSNYSQEVQIELVNHLQELKLQSALELRQKLNELANLESKLLLKVLGEYRVQHENTLSSLRQTLSQTTNEVKGQSANFTQAFQQRNQEIKAMFGIL